jgi:hypothetical protein
MPPLPGGTAGPFVASAQVMARVGPVVAAVATLTDEGRGRLVATGFTRWRAC